MSKRVQVGPWAINVRGTNGEELPAVVLVHGIGVSGDYFRPFASTLAQTHNVIVPDLPGYGTSPTPQSPLAVTELAEVVGDLISALGLKAPIAIGHSMGAQVVLALVKNHPGMCSKYILLGPPVDHNERTGWQQAKKLFQDSLREPLRVNVIIFRDYLRMGLFNYLRTLRFMLANCAESDIRECMIPGLVVRGERDPISSRSYARRLAGAAPNAQLREVPGALHVVQYSQPEELMRICQAFLKS